ncbi:response regulator transcription factor [Alishewanella sp. HL-SH06]|uniref:response regulator transcription factor n=1 Tax=Alishewanella sp. HL-SH06 TaxID=3461144 RepID=UPI004041D366
MERFSRLVLLTDETTPLSTYRHAKTVGIDVEQCPVNAFSQLHHYKGVLAGYQFSSDTTAKKGFSARLLSISRQVPLFVFHAERQLVDPNRAIFAGLRGVIYSDEQAEMIKRALQSMMAGQLYYARNVMSDTLDALFQLREQSNRRIKLPALLTDQEQRVSRLIAEGARNKEIAEQLQISANTVKVHVSAIFKKTHSRNRTELVRWLQEPHE